MPDLHDADASIEQVRARIEPAIENVLARIEQAAARTDRDPRSIQILLATKTRTAAEVSAALAVFRERGIEPSVGENRAQEIVKYDDPLLANDPAPRHFIGRLQTNKARDVVAFAELIHSVDRDDIMEALARRAEQASTSRRVLIQVNTSGEESKGGYPPQVAQLAPVLERLHANPWLEPAGLMTIGANSTDATVIRSSLAALRTVREELADPAMQELSMGMSNDVEIAIEEGATIVRLGSAVFGPRSN